MSLPHLHLSAIPTVTPNFYMIFNTSLLGFFQKNHNQKNQKNHVFFKNSPQETLYLFDPTWKAELNLELPCGFEQGIPDLNTR